MKEVLIVLIKAQFLYKLEKYEFYKKKIKFLKYIIISEGLFIDSIKVNIILN